MPPKRDSHVEKPLQRRLQTQAPLDGKDEDQDAAAATCAAAAAPPAEIGRTNGANPSPEHAAPGVQTLVYNPRAAIRDSLPDLWPHGDTKKKAVEVICAPREVKGSLKSTNSTIAVAPSPPLLRGMPIFWNV